jgi:hypothetical protein
MPATISLKSNCGFTTPGSCAATVTPPSKMANPKANPLHSLRCLLGSDFVALVVMFSFPFLSTINSQRSTVSNAKCLDATPFFVPAPLPLIHDRFLQIFARLF